MNSGRAFFIWLMALALVFIISLCAGHVWSTPPEVWDSLFDSRASLIKLWRLPRVLTAASIGFLLGLSGAIFQGVFRNPLAEPWLIGSSGGAAIGAALALLLPWSLPPEISLPLFSFAGALGAATLVLSLARVAGSLDASTLLLAGIAVSSILIALRSFLMMVLANESISLQVVMSWLMGAVQPPEGQALWGLILLTGLIFFLAFFMLARPLDILGLGENMAAAYGLRLKRVLAGGLLLGSAAAALAVSAGGVIAFAGLAAPHISRFFVGTRHKLVLPLSSLVGACLVTGADALSRSLLPPGEIPVGLITAVFGGPFFLFLLARKARSTWN